MVFQDSYASLNPRLTIEDSIAFAPQVHGTPRAEAVARARDLLARVGLAPQRFAERYPHELSGGQRQRINIARALALQPRIIILDEAVSALDKSVEAQVLNLLLDLKDEFGLTYIFISHDLNVVRYISDRVMVMYLGQVVEIGDSEVAVRGPAPPLHAGAAEQHPVDGPGPPHREARAGRRPAEPDQPAFGLPLPHPLRSRRSGVQPARAHAGGRRGRPPGGLPDVRSRQRPPERRRHEERGAHDRPEARRAFVDIRNLTVTFTGGRKPVRAVGGVDLQVQRGEVVALIGESGSGKSVTLRSLLRLHPPRRTQMGGQLRVGGQDVLKMSRVAAGRLPRQGHVDDLPGAAAGAGPGVHGGRADRREHPPPRGRQRRRGAASARWSCSSACASPAPSGGWPPIRTR